MHPTKKDILSALIRYNFVLKILERITSNVESKNIKDKRWFIFSEKIARKYLNQAYTFQQIIQDDIYFEKGNEDIRFVDFSSMFSLLRIQLETYSVFYHLFADKCHIEEKIIRFRLWELDGLRSMERYEKPNDADVSKRLSKNKEDIEYCISVIRGFDFFKNLDSNQQDWLIKYANWKFSSESLKNKNKKKWKLSINDMIINTGLSESLFRDWYSFTSTHTHSSYWSVIQNDTLTLEEKITMEYIAIMQGGFVTSFFIKDFCGIYEIARLVLDSLTKNEREVIDSFDDNGRKNEKELR
ncbi:hypothetical protein [Aequorivita antarctica]|uniref:Uncharacterized protein n=1 Tax=Aequorivita antarctica TaxID=153266 RepID=A0A5C6YWT9_9FLAO|nr:hypothetical protein [Aequorivita antarctica]TXD72070.1 hypothetical protein ESU54_13505 [Aequorivita antarctica]SRX75656.1 hypothetical protein AEQU3_02652 [Aequorivita antarctica]